MKIHKDYYPFMCCAFVALAIYSLFALCYGVLPYSWSGNQKGVFICCELLFPGFAFALVLTNKED